MPNLQNKHQVVIIGAGSGGIAVAARLRRQRPALDIAIIEPNEYHYYQPAWTLVGGGAYHASKTRRTVAACLPRNVRHIRQAVQELNPQNQQLVLADGTTIEYEYLVIAAGIQSNWQAIKGLTDTLGKNGVCSNYHYDFAPYTWELVQNFKGGTAIFTQPAGALKCPGAPQKALYLSADHFRRNGIKAASLQFHSAAATIFGVPFYAQALDQVMAGYAAQASYGSKLVEVRGSAQIAVFAHEQNGQTVHSEHKFDLLHVVPPQSAPDFIRNSSLADANGWLDVDKHTLRHNQYANIFGLGDCTSTPNSKTAAAIKSQAPVLANNLLSALAGLGNTSAYDGYAGCPVTTSKGKVMLAEFTYGGAITPSFPFDPRVPRRFYWWLKRSYLPWFYWNVLLKGYRQPETHKQRTYPSGVPSVIK